MTLHHLEAACDKAMALQQPRVSHLTLDEFMNLPPSTILGADLPCPYEAQDRQSEVDWEYLTRLGKAFALGSLIFAAGLWIGATRAKADQGNPDAAFQFLVCDPVTGAPITLAPQRHGDIITYDVTPPEPEQINHIAFPPFATGDSGGHAPDTPPATVPLPAAILMLVTAVGALFAIALLANRKGRA